MELNAEKKTRKETKIIITFFSHRSKPRSLIGTCHDERMRVPCLKMETLLSLG